MRANHWHRFIVFALAGCAASSSYLYSPQGATYWSDGYPATSNPVPPEAPQGRVDVTSFGVVEIKPDGVAPIATVHVRLTITNDGDATPWTIAPSDQQVEIAGMGRSRPIYVNSDMPTLPTITIGQRERRLLDFYYALPPGIDDDDELAGFEMLWQVTTPARVYSSRTRFQRIEQEPAATNVNVVYYAGWGPYWWYDPMYPRLVFIHHRPIVVHRPGHVIITRPPVRHYRVIRDHRR
jgi:hypothetical protein